jgi:hypothetical protein
MSMSGACLVAWCAEQDQDVWGVSVWGTRSLRHEVLLRSVRCLEWSFSPVRLLHCYHVLC